MGLAKIPTYLETGAKRTFAGALDWPGWCRAGRDEAGALEALHGAGRRYAKVLRVPGSASNRRRIRRDSPSSNA